MTKVLERLIELREFLENQSREAEDLGRLPDKTAQALKETGVMRMLQPKRFGGFESHPVDFMRAVLEAGEHDGSTGWVAGVVGVHPHELAQTDLRLQEEIWGEDEDTWVASPYAPMGRARPVDGGYVFNGRWSFSSGTDHCQWVMIGGVVTDPDGTLPPGRPDPSRVMHFCLPRGDYEIVADSWEVMGLRGSGSRDLIVTDAFVPDYRAIPQDEIVAGTAARQLGLDNPLYAIPRAVMFSGAITCATLALAKGVLRAYKDYSRERVQLGGTRAAVDPNHLQALGRAEADVDASISHFLTDIETVYDAAATGTPVSLDLRVTVRRNQVRATHRAMEAADQLFMHGGGGALRLDQPLQRAWRDLHAGMNHIVNVAEPVYQLAGLQAFGHEIPADARV